MSLDHTISGQLSNLWQDGNRSVDKLTHSRAVSGVTSMETELGKNQVPFQRVIFLGYTVVRPPKIKLVKTTFQIPKATQVTRQNIISFLDLPASIPAVQWAQCHMRPFHSYLLNWDDQVESLEEVISISQVIKQSLQWWKRRPTSRRTLGIYPSDTHYYRCECNRMGSSSELSCPSRTLGHRLVKSFFKSKGTNSPLGTVGLQGRNSRETCTRNKMTVLWSTSTIGGVPDQKHRCGTLIFCYPGWRPTLCKSGLFTSKIGQYSCRLLESATTACSGVGNEPADLHKINPEMGNASG